jgi:hypothetical protein
MSLVNIHDTVSNTGDPKDRLCLLGIRRAILDSFWARETATVDANRREAKRYIFDASLMGIMLLMRSLEKGINAEFVQYETIRKVRSHFSNFVHTVPGGVGNMFTTSDKVVNGITHSSTNTPWFKRFMKGCHSQMGNVWCPDRPLTTREALLCQSTLEANWKTFEREAVG